MMIRYFQSLLFVLIFHLVMGSFVSAQMAPCYPTVWNGLINSDKAVWVDHVRMGKESDMIFVGRFTGTLQVFETKVLSKKMEALFVLNLDSLGNVKWLYTYDSPGKIVINDLELDSSGTVLISGNIPGEWESKSKKVKRKLGKTGGFLMVKLKDGLVYTQVAANKSKRKNQYLQTIAKENETELRLKYSYKKKKFFGKGEAGKKKLEMVNLASELPWTALYQVDITGDFDPENVLMAWDPTGHSWLFGTYKGTLGWGEENYSSKSEVRFFVLKTNPKGEKSFFKNWNTNESIKVTSLLPEDGGKILLTGSFRDTLIIDNHRVISKGEEDIFVLMMNENGEVEWLQSFGSKGEDKPFDIQAKRNSGIYLAAYFEERIELGFTMDDSLEVNRLRFLWLTYQGDLVWYQSSGNGKEVHDCHIEFENKYGVNVGKLLVAEGNTTGDSVFLYRVEELPYLFQQQYEYTFSQGKSMPFCPEEIKYPERYQAEWSPKLGVNNPDKLCTSLFPWETTEYQLTLTDPCGGKYYLKVRVQIIP